MTRRVQEPTEEMIAKLPLWARTYIEDLTRENGNSERQAQRLEEERITLSPSDELPTRVTWEYLMEGAHPIPSDANVRFYLRTPLQRQEWITFRWRKSEQMVDVNASGSLIIQPQASNSVYLTVEER